MAKTDTVAEVSTSAAPIKATPADDVAKFVIRADSKFGIQAMIAVNRVAQKMLPRAGASEVATALRSFDLYEEAHRAASK